jgi:hypothetical protein
MKTAPSKKFPELFSVGVFLLKFCKDIINFILAELFLGMFLWLLLY